MQLHICEISGRRTKRLHQLGGRPLLSGVAALLLLLMVATQTRGEPLTWVGGAGTWDFNTTSNWTGAASAPWTDEIGVDTAVFGGTAGAVTVNGTGSTNGTITTNGMTFNVTGYTLSGGTITLAGATPTIQVNTAVTQNATISSTIAGSSLTKSGTGQLTLSGANTYTGGTILNAGDLILNNTSALGNGSLTINGGTIVRAPTTSLVMTGITSQTWNSNFAFRAGNGDNVTLNLGTGTVTLGGSIAISMSSNSGKAIVTVGGNISDGGSNYSLALSSPSQGANQLLLAGNNSWGGGTTVNSGMLTIGSNGALPGGTLTMAGGNLGVSGTRSLSNTVNQVWNANFAFNESNTNASGTLNTGAGTVTLTGSRTVNVHQGQLSIDGVIGDGGSGYAFTYAGGRFATGILRLNAANTFGGGLTVRTNGNRTGLYIGHAGALGTGTFKISAAGGTPSTNNVIRIANVTASALTISTNNAQDWDQDFTFGEVAVGGSALGQSLNLGTGAVSLGTTSAAAVRTLNVYSQTLTVGGVISNGTTTSGLTKIGGGTLALAGANQYTGATTVTAGTLRLDSTGSLANADIAVSGTGTLTGTGTIVFNLGATPDQVVLSAGTLNISGLTVSFAGQVTQAEYVLIDYSVGGTLTTATNALTGNTFFSVANLPSHMEIVNDTLNERVVLVPEPAGLGLMGLAAIGLLNRRRRTS